MKSQEEKHTNVSHGTSVANFLPAGAAFERRFDETSELKKLLNGFGGELGRQEDAIQDYYDERDINTTVQLIQEWESAVGIPVLSMGHLVEPGRALAWRGPMAGNALTQLIDAHWGDVDTLVVDLPPGTGDVQLTMMQRFKPLGAVLVSTPQDLALIDAARAGQLFDQAGVPVIGLVENMAGYACPHCGEISDPFGKGGVETAAGRLDLPFLGRIPLDLAIREGSDRGAPPALDTGALGAPFHDIAAKVDAWIGARN